jgi:hypothetical protein
VAGYCLSVAVCCRPLSGSFESVAGCCKTTLGLKCSITVNEPSFTKLMLVRKKTCK